MFINVYFITYVGLQTLDSPRIEIWVIKLINGDYLKIKKWKYNLINLSTFFDFQTNKLQYLLRKPVFTIHSYCIGFLNQYV